jgi:enoyl-CoA hydratase/carnithine racemase
MFTSAWYTPRMADAPLEYTRRDDHIGILTLNRPDTQNRMTLALLDAFSTALDHVIADRTLRCLVVTGRGSCFCAGADLGAPLTRPAGTLPHEASYAMYEAFLKVADVPIPVVAGLNGHAVGGGLGLALLCDLRIANEDAKIGAGFAKLGLHAGLGITYLLPRLAGIACAAELLFTGNTISGRRAAEIGLVSAAVPAATVLEYTLSIAADIAAAAPLAVREMKRSMIENLGLDVRRAARIEALRQAESLRTEDAREGVAALLGHRPPTFVGR